MELEEAAKIFGVNPEHIGLRFRAWWIVDEQDAKEFNEDFYLSEPVEIGYLGVRARDGSANPSDSSAFRLPNFVTTCEDDFDNTYRYYFFKPLANV